MIMSILLKFSWVVLALLLKMCPTNTQLLLSPNASITANLLGSCPTFFYNESSLAHLDSFLQLCKSRSHIRELRVFSWTFEEEEMKKYTEKPTTLTWVNDKLALGVVDGQARAQAWIERQDTAWTITPEHPRSNKSSCMEFTRRAVSAPTALYDPSVLRRQLVHPYLLHQYEAIIHDSGIIASSCGYFQSHESCETKYKFIGRKWYKQCLSQVQSLNLQWGDIFREPASLSDAALCVPKRPTLRPTRKPTGPEGQLVNSSLQFQDKVFIMTSNWDHNYHHLLFDSITRLIRYLPFLRAHPDVKIHSRRTEQFGHNVHSMYEKSAALRKRILELLGLDPARLVFGTIAAKEVFYPRSMICNFPTTNALEIRSLSSYLLTRAHEIVSAERKCPADRFPFTVHQTAAKAAAANQPKKIILQQRYCPVAANCTNTWRSWTAELHLDMVQRLMETFPTSEIISISDYNSSRADNLACEVMEYSTADVLIGHHGAGLTNAIFMPPGSLLVETAGQFDGRMLPVCGYHGPIAAMMGLHHLIHYFDWKGKEPFSLNEIAPRIKQFFARIPRTVELIPVSTVLGH